MQKKIDITSPEFQNAVSDVSLIVRFEHWLRFYFVVEDGGALKLSVPGETMENLKSKEGFLAPLAEMLNNGEITQEGSQLTVCNFVGARLDGTKYPIGVCDRVFDSSAYKIENYVFSLWLKGHEPYLDEREHEFAEWEEMYSEWRKLDEVKEYVAKLTQGSAAQGDGSGTVH